MSNVTVLHQDVSAEAVADKWLLQDLKAAAADVAAELIELKSKRYNENFKDFAPLRIRIPVGAKRFIASSHNITARKNAEIRDDLAREIESQLGQGSQVSFDRRIFGRRMIVASRF